MSITDMMDPDLLPPLRVALAKKKQRTGMGLRAFAKAAKTSPAYVIKLRNQGKWPVQIPAYKRWTEILFNDSE